MRGNFNVPRPAALIEQPAHPTVALANTICISLVVIFPLLIYLALAYRRHRARVLQQQIRTLNRIWRLESRQKQS